jgi:nucleotide-binding universal stress UspA family protein
VLGNLSVVTVAYSGQDMDESVARAQESLTREAETLDGGGGDVKKAVVVDPSPGRAILNFAREHGMDLVVIASRSRGGLDRFLLGSVADKVIRGGETALLVQQAETEEISAQNSALAEAAEADEP